MGDQESSKARHAGEEGKESFDGRLGWISDDLEGLDGLSEYLSGLGESKNEAGELSVVLVPSFLLLLVVLVFDPVDFRTLDEDGTKEERCSGELDIIKEKPGQPSAARREGGRRARGHDLTLHLFETNLRALRCLYDSLTRSKPFLSLR